MELLILYLIIINVEAFASMFADKQLAKDGGWRIPEKVLMGEAILGGSIGATAGMYLFRHKTRKPLFCIGIPVVMALQLIAAVALWQLR